ncbi:LamG-like jellyroll fold domain-containing protein [Nocardiopsis synnemataformans]|uniref:LamG-like jellyroll fold domain-containing protein n=1 Tax=Nocardiopsis synnemataformans TaxID=61305 RepID=UPI003EB99645
MLSPLTRVAAVTTAAALALSLLTAVPAAADDDDSTPPGSEDAQGTSEEFDALALAEQTGEPVEIPSLTDEKTRHFANPDGTFTAEVSAIPARVRSADGWVDVDTTLAAGDDGLVRPRAAGMDIAFSGGGDAPMARIGIGSNSVALDWVEELPVPMLDGDQATYADVLPDVDLVLTAGVEGFTQVLVVHTPEAAASPELAELELPLDATGVSVVADEHGNIEAIGDEGGQSVFTAQAPAMWDSTGQDEASGEDPLLAPTTGARTALVETEVEVDSIRLVPDQGMLTDETTEYPVYIDPSVSASRPNWASVDRAFPNQAYFNPDEESAGVGRIEWDRVYTRRAFFQFSVPGRIKQDTTTIHSATLRTEVEWAYSCNSNSYVQLHRTDRFNSKTTWNNQPTTRTLLDTQNVRGGWATCPASSGVEFDATAAYQWGADNDESYVYLRLKERDESGTTAWRRFDIDGKPPVLVIDYNNKPSQVATSTMFDSLGGVCSTDQDNPRLINDTTVTFRATIRDYDARSEVWELANRPAALEGRWQLDETEGTSVADSSDHGLTATLHGDPLTAWNQALNEVTWAPGVSLDPTAQEHIRTADAAIRTDRSYSVAAWVRLDEVGHNSTAVAQDGDFHSAFYLSYQHSFEWDNWVMKLPPEDTMDASGWHRALSDHAPDFGRWTHLAATYDHTSRRVTLYVDGVENGSAEVTDAWHTGGPIVIGGALFEQQFSDAWAGDISDVHLYQGVLTETDLYRVRLGRLPVT